MNSAGCPLRHKAEVTAGESSSSKDRESPRLVRLKLIPALQTTIILHLPRPLEGRCREARVSGTGCGACGARSLDEPPRLREARFGGRRKAGRRRPAAHSLRATGRGSARAHYEALPGAARPIPNAPVTSRGELSRSRGTYGESAARRRIIVRFWRAERRPPCPTTDAEPKVCALRRAIPSW